VAPYDGEPPTDVSTTDVDREVDEGGAERAGDGGDHLAGGFLAAALDLGEVLGRDAGPLGGVGEGLAALVPQAPQTCAEDDPPQGLRSRGVLPAGLRRLGHASP
jgi:hypothetical protein